MTTPESVGITQFLPGTPEYDLLVGNVRGRADRKGVKTPGAQSISRLYYDNLADAYNSLPVEGLVLVAPPTQVHNDNLATILRGRGVVENIDYHLVVPSVDLAGTPLAKGARPRYLRRLTQKPIGKVLTNKLRPDFREKLEKALANIVNERRARLSLLVKQIPALKVCTPAAQIKLSEWLAHPEKAMDNPIEQLLADLKVDDNAPTQDMQNMQKELDDLREQAYRESQGLLALGVLQTKLNEQVGGEVVFLEPPVAKP